MSFRGFGPLVKASVLMFARDRQAFFWSFAFPVFFMVLLGAAFGSTGKVSFDVGIVDHDQSPASEAATTAFRNVTSFKVRAYDDEDRARAALKDGRLDIVVVFPVGFSTAMTPPDGSGNGTLPAPVQVPVLYDKSDPARSLSAVSIVQQVLDRMGRAASGQQDRVVIEREGVAVANLRYIDFLAPGIIAMAVMTNSIFGLSLYIASAREKGLLKRLRATPLSPATIIGSRIVLSLMVVGMQATVITVIATLVFGVTIVGNPLVFGLVIAFGSTVFIIMGFTIASFARSVETAETLSNVVAMPMMFLGNIFIPTDDMPGYVKVISNAMPVTYFADALRQVMLKGAGLEDIAMDLLILLITGVIVFGITVRFFRWD